MDEKLQSIFEFLKANQEFNTKVQTGFYQDTLAPYDNVSSKLKSLFWRIQNTQSQPRLENVSKFWKEIEGKDISSFELLISSLGGEVNNTSYLNLFKSLRRKASWGEKTTALFVKALFHTHADNRYDSFSFLPNAPKALAEGDKLYLPVDQVIKNIFKKITEKKNLSFDNINKILLKSYNDDRMEVWDDLWFWGFITQKGTGSNREFIWNEAKYWSLLHTPKDRDSVKLVKGKANEFIKLIKQ